MADEVALRPCTTEDASVLALVGAATFLDAFAGKLPGPSIVEHCRRHHTPESYRHYLDQPRCSVWIAETVSHKGPVGYCMVTAPDLPIPDPKETDLELKRIYVLSRFHKTGTGRRLFQKAEEDARALGASRLFLGVYKDNVRALDFYHRVGFREVGTRTFQMGFDTFEDFVLCRDL